jgi:Uma2 family endonuclease
MSTSSIIRGTALEPEEQLHNGDRMSRQEFHRLYEKTPDGFKAELIGGIVYVASPLKLRHGTSHPMLTAVLVAYQGSTPGVEVGDNTTVLLGDEGEPQPDLFLRVLPEFGGQSTTSVDDYVEGPPELVAEVAHSSRSIDLNAKRDDYARYGVLEYLVVNLAARRLHWLDLQTGQDLPPDPDGIICVRRFPGLWIHIEALLAKDYARLMATLQQGLATPEHAAFVQRLADARRSN